MPGGGMNRDRPFVGIGVDRNVSRFPIETGRGTSTAGGAAVLRMRGRRLMIHHM